MFKPIYLDYAATTPCDERVLAEMLPYFGEKFGNSSSSHYYGLSAFEDLSLAREKIAAIINAEFDEIVFTSGATESTRIVIERVCSKENVIITLKTEHKSVFESCNLVKNSVFLDVLPNGLLDHNLLRENIVKHEAKLVSICFINNETGVVQNVKEISKICHEHGALLHIDATQALCKVPIDVKNLECDFISASGHKIYGPKGVGLVYFNRKHYKLIKQKGETNADPEFGIRGGTIPVPLCIGFCAACNITNQEILDNLKHIENLRTILVNGIRKNLEEIYINGENPSNYPGIVNISFRGCEGEALMMEASRICISSGSACTSNRLTISHVLEAMNVLPDIAQSSLRISIGKNTSESDINIAIEDLVAATKKLRKMSPLWEMIKNGIDVNSVFKDSICHR
ncbi:MAG: aminotransferase class V-fold PLP-dependent enzyme [Holosporales bacterium]|jgi:cysteine desulfurase|nr:aminotransferase class V-fold PLP-dependent enzyme [Holosporales bacterium]